MRSANREARRTERTTRRTSERALREQQDRARQRLSNMRSRVEDVDMRAHNAIVTGVLPRIQGAVDSWCRKRVRIAVEMDADQFSAATDFVNIMLHIPDFQVSTDFLGDLRGLAYHEAGHIRKTVPYPALVEEVADARQTDPKALQASVKDSNGAPLRVEDLHRAWNMLEDQRMETSMVQDSKNLGRYYNVIVLTHVVNEINDRIYCWLMAREHIDADVIESARELMVAAHGEAEVERIEDVTWQYVEATDACVMWDAVVQLAVFLDAHHVPAINFDIHEFEIVFGGDGGSTLPEWVQDMLDGSATRRGNGAGMPGDGDGEEGDGDGDGDGGNTMGDDSKPTDDKPSKGDGGTGAGNKPGNGFGQKVREALDRATEARNKDKNLLNDLRSYNEALHDTRNHTPLPRVPTSFINTAGADQAEAGRVNRSLRLQMEAARSEHAPSWQSGQRTGVLDVIRYKTRQPGDMEFFRNEAPGGDLHLPNLAVSVLLDGSGSMSSYVTKLGVAAYAVKTACDACSVPCTVSIFDSRAHLLWDAEDRPVNIPDAFCPLGGTDPTEALNVIDGQMHDKARHLVLIMTDGAWGGWQHKSLADYQYPNRDLVVLFWNCAPTGIQGLSNVPHARIDSLMEIPQIVRRYLSQSM